MKGKSDYPLPILICPMVDARRMEVFTSIYDINLKEVMPAGPLVLNEHSFNNYLGNYSIIFAGNGNRKWGAICPRFDIEINRSEYNIRDFAEVALKKYEEKAFTELAYSEPAYLKMCTLVH